MVCACGGKYMWSYDTIIKSDRPERQFKVNVFKCVRCYSVFFVDKDMRKPNTGIGSGKSKFDEEQKKKYKKYVPKATEEEEIFYGKMYINSKGKDGVKPKGYVSTKSYTLGGITYPPIRKARGKKE